MINHDKPRVSIAHIISPTIKFHMMLKRVPKKNILFMPKKKKN
jgi:hypothetical protein